MKLLSSLLSVLAAEVGAVGGVHLDLLTFADEQRNLNLGTGLNGGRLGAGVGAVAPADPVRYG